MVSAAVVGPTVVPYLNFSHMLEHLGQVEGMQKWEALIHTHTPYTYIYLYIFIEKHLSPLSKITVQIRES